MSGFGASFGGDDEEVVESSGAGDTQVPMDANPLAADMLADDMIEAEAETLDVLQARRLAVLPAEELIRTIHGSDASPKTKLFAVSMKLEDHQAQFDHLRRLKEDLATLNGEPAPWWRQPSGYRAADWRHSAFARGKAESAFRDAGGSGPFAAVTTAKAAARFAAQQVLGRAADWLDRLARRFD